MVNINHFGSAPGRDALRRRQGQRHRQRGRHGDLRRLPGDEVHHARPGRCPAAARLATDRAMPAARGRPASSFTRALVSGIVGLLVTLGMALLVAMAWQGMTSTEEAARQDDQRDARPLHGPAADRHARRRADGGIGRARECAPPRSPGPPCAPPWRTCRPRSSSSPTLSTILGIVLRETGRITAISNAPANGLRSCSGCFSDRVEDPTVRNFVLTDKGFAPHLAYPTDGY